MKNILVTGANGFVGKNLMSYLAKGSFTTTGISRDTLNSISPEALSGGDVIIHLAGKAHDLKNAINPQEYYDVNYELTKNLYDSFLKSDAKKFIFISSVKAAADTVDTILTEDDAPQPETHYGKSKLIAEKYIESLALPTGKSYVILRPCMIHGPGNKGNFNLLYQIVKSGIPYPLAAFHNQRSFLSIDNFCFIIKEVINGTHIPVGVYNVADDEPLSTTELVQIFAKSLNKEAKLWKAPKSMLRAVARIGDIIKLPLNTERLDKLTENYVVSNKKIKAVLSSELPLKSREGLMYTANSFKDNLHV